MDEYETRCEETGWKRLAIALYKNGTLSEMEYYDLVYPSIDSIEEAENMEIFAG